MTARKHPSAHKVHDPWELFRCGCGHPVYGSAPRLGCLYCECEPGMHVRRADATATGSERADAAASQKAGEGT